MGTENWKTLDNGSKVNIDENGIVISGPEIFIGKHISLCGGKLSNTKPQIAEFEKAVEKNSGDHYAGAKEFFKEFLQGHSVGCKTEDGEKEVFFTGGSWQELKRGLKKDTIKASLFPHMPDIIVSGEIKKEALYKSRDDKAKAFYSARKTININGVDYIVIVDVIDREKSVPQTSVYNMTREGTKNYEERAKK